MEKIKPAIAPKPSLCVKSIPLNKLVTPIKPSRHKKLNSNSSSENFLNDDFKISDLNDSLTNNRSLLTNPNGSISVNESSNINNELKAFGVIFSDLDNCDNSFYTKENEINNPIVNLCEQNNSIKSNGKAHEQKYLNSHNLMNYCDKISNCDLNNDKINLKKCSNETIFDLEKKLHQNFDIESTCVPQINDSIQNIRLNLAQDKTVSSYKTDGLPDENSMHHQSFIGTHECDMNINNNICSNINIEIIQIKTPNIISIDKENILSKNIPTPRPRKHVKKNNNNNLEQFENINVITDNNLNVTSIVTDNIQNIIHSDFQDTNIVQLDKTHENNINLNNLNQNTLNALFPVHYQKEISLNLMEKYGVCADHDNKRRDSVPNLLDNQHRSSSIFKNILKKQASTEVKKIKSKSQSRSSYQSMPSSSIFYRDLKYTEVFSDIVEKPINIQIEENSFFEKKHLKKQKPVKLFSDNDLNYHNVINRCSTPKKFDSINDAEILNLKQQIENSKDLVCNEENSDLNFNINDHNLMNRSIYTPIFENNSSNNKNNLQNEYSFSAEIKTEHILKEDSACNSNGGNLKNKQPYKESRKKSTMSDSDLSENYIPRNNSDIGFQKARNVENLLVQNSESEVFISDSDASSCSEEESFNNEDVNTISTSNDKKAFLVAKELLKTEEKYVDTLNLLNYDFINVIEQGNATASHEIVSIDIVRQILKHLPSLQKINEDLLNDLNTRIDNWLNYPRMSDIFIKKAPFLKLYSDYFKDHNKLVQSLDDIRKRLPDLDQLISEFENGTRCGKLAIKHYMLKPIQRLPQYRLLLSEYFRYLPDQSPEYLETKNAILIVEQVLNHINKSMKYEDHLNNMLKIQNHLIGNYEVINRGRVLIKEGILNKLSRKEMQPRNFYLFNDVLLCTTPQGSFFKLNNVLPLTDIKICPSINEDFQNEFSIISTERSFTVVASSEQEKVDWLTAFDIALSENTDKSKESLSTKIGTIAPVWIPDDRVSRCFDCKETFNIRLRRHHCRGCGKILCDECSSYRAPLQYLKNKAQRVCNECYSTIFKDVSGMEENVMVEGESLKNILLLSFRETALNKLDRRKIPSVLEEVQASDNNVDMSGYLFVWKNKKWKRMWFVLKDKVLYTYKAPKDTAAYESTPLLGYEIDYVTKNISGVDQETLFEIRHKNLESKKFHCDNTLTRDRWMNVMKLSIIP